MHLSHDVLFCIGIRVAGQFARPVVLSNALQFVLNFRTGASVDCVGNKAVVCVFYALPTP